MGYETVGGKRFYLSALPDVIPQRVYNLANKLAAAVKTTVAVGKASGSVTGRLRNTDGISGACKGWRLIAKKWNTSIWQAAEL